MALHYFLTLNVFDDDGQLVYQQTGEFTPQEMLAERGIDINELEDLPDLGQLHFLEQAQAGVGLTEALEAAKAFVGNVN